jgi:MFS family permease
MSGVRSGGAGVAVAALCLVQFVDVLGVTVVVTALPRMLSELGAPASSASLVSTGYAMFFGGLLMLGARLGDRFGHRRTILAGLAVFVVGAVLAAVAGSIVLLVAARCLQGAAAAASVPSALRLLTTVTAEGPVRRRAIAAWSATGAAAGASGFVVGGVITDLTSWRVIFWAYVPVAAVMAVGIVRGVPVDESSGERISLNVAGAATFAAAVMAAVVGATLIAEPAHRQAGVVLIVVAAGLTMLFVLVDRAASAPLLPRDVLRQRRLRAGAVGGFLNTATTSSAIILVTLYLQDTLHRSPIAAAATLLPFSLAVVAGSALAAPALQRMGPELVVAIGLALIAAAIAALPAVVDTAWALPLAVAVSGLGIGLSSVAATTLGTDVAMPWRATASGIINTTAQLGTAIGIAVILLIAAATDTVPADGSPRPAIAWAAAAAAAAAGAVAFALLRQHRSADPG